MLAQSWCCLSNPRNPDILLTAGILHHWIGMQELHLVSEGAYKTANTFAPREWLC